MPHRASFRLISVLALVALASCGANGSTKQTKGDDPVENATVARLSLTSEAFTDGQPVPVKYTCDGADETPTLNWGNPPSGTRSFALVVDDPDAPNGTFRHWGVYDIPATARSIGSAKHVGAAVNNDMGKIGYGGPCPPKDDKPHHYHFKLFALDVEHLDMGPSAKVVDVENAAARHALAQGELVGTYQRK